ncbi:uncharacterized protein LOC127595834 isoform X2 [Hippocampus zosterae]|uniref:uncharacterized protein LOC127595834 isoform X2 n=2 Tax=Hippocampus zosterae TaxID=109293 RepID=UPI00223CB686|nr:uncharacterized protein LOC127595834 isoform X2 [Hippocampus zosterae]XP_051913695.1 uncharacterized protein LOC127595834 isoform X2 [Hippocampus zosterae]
MSRIQFPGDGLSPQKFTFCNRFCEMLKVSEIPQEHADVGLPPLQEDSGERPVPDETEFNTSGTKPAFSAYPDTLLNGMKGYEITAGDLDFLRKIQVEKHVKELWAELEVVRSVLQRELVLEPMLTSSENVQDDLDKSSSYSELVEHHKQVLGIMLSSIKVLEQNATSLLAVVNKEDVDRAPSKKKKKKKQQQALSHMEKDISRTKEESKETEQLVKQLVGCQMLIQQLMRKMAELNSKLAQPEIERRGVVKPVAPKTDLPAGKDASKRAYKPHRSPSKSTVERAPKAAAGQQKLADNSKPGRGRPKAVSRAKAAASQAESGKEADNPKHPEPARPLEHQQETNQPNIVLRRSKRIAERQLHTTKCAP